MEQIHLGKERIGARWQPSERPASLSSISKEGIGQVLCKMPGERHGSSSKLRFGIGHRSFAHENKPRDRSRVKNELRNLMKDGGGRLSDDNFNVMKCSSNDAAQLQLVRKIQVSP